MSVTVILPVRDEELHLAECLGSVTGWAERVVVVDSGSTDRTVAIAQAAGVEVVVHAYEGPADQKNWALENLGIDTRWVLFLDADERVTLALAGEIRARTADPENPAAGYFVNRRIIWCGRWIRHGGWFPNWNLRLVRVGRGRYEDRRVHEHVIVDGPTAKLAGHLIHEDRRDLTHQIAKHNRYSNLEAAEYDEHLSGVRDDYGRLFARDPLARRRWIKTRIWARLPAKALFYFLWAWVVRLGFLDGAVGLRYHAMHAVYKLFDDMKLWERRRPSAGPTYWERHGGEASARDPVRDPVRELAESPGPRGPLPERNAFPGQEPAAAGDPEGLSSGVQTAAIDPGRHKSLGSPGR